jgi:DNA-binding HxlR family transcriptional regulator
MRELEAVGVVRRAVDGGPPVRVRYGLTEKGEDLSEVVDTLQRWGRKWCSSEAAVPAPSPEGAAAVIEQVRTGSGDVTLA